MRDERQFVRDERQFVTNERQFARDERQFVRGYGVSRERRTLGPPYNLHDLLVLIFFPQIAVLAAYLLRKLLRAVMESNTRKCP